MLISATTTVKTRDGTAHVWWPAETECGTVEEIFDRLIKDQALLLTRLETRVQNGNRVIVGRSKVILTIGGLALIQPLHLTLSEPGA